MGETHAARLARIETENAHTNQELARGRQTMMEIKNTLSNISEKIDEQFRHLNDRMSAADIDRDSLKAAQVKTQQDVADMKPEITVIRESLIVARWVRRAGYAIFGSGILTWVAVKWEILVQLWRK